MGLPPLTNEDIISIVIKEIDRYMMENNVKHYAIRRIRIDRHQVVAYVVAVVGNDVKQIKFVYDEENGLRPIS